MGVNLIGWWDILMSNVDFKEIVKFEVIVDNWWDLEGEFKFLYDINLLCLNYIN